MHRGLLASQLGKLHHRPAPTYLQRLALHAQAPRPQREIEVAQPAGQYKVEHYQTPRTGVPTGRTFPGGALATTHRHEDRGRPAGLQNQQTNRPPAAELLEHYQVLLPHIRLTAARRQGGRQEHVPQHARLHHRHPPQEPEKGHRGLGKHSHRHSNRHSFNSPLYIFR